jgi:protein-disulfide isomerase
MIETIATLPEVFMTFRRALLFTLLLTSFAVPLHADDAKPLTREEVRDIVRQTLQENPELIIKSVEDYQNKQQAEQISKNSRSIASLKQQLTQDPHSPSFGDPNAKISVVEFFDYHCGYCKRFYGTLKKLSEEDKDTRIVFKEFPILSEDSELASRAALAVYSIDKEKYFSYHTTLMGYSGRFTREMLLEKAKELGINPEKFTAALDSDAINKELARNKRLGRAIGISGTPAIVIGDQMLPGAIDYDTLKEKVDEAKKG